MILAAISFNKIAPNWDYSIRMCRAEAVARAPTPPPTTPHPKHPPLTAAPSRALRPASPPRCFTVPMGFAPLPLPSTTTRACAPQA